MIRMVVKSALLHDCGLGLRFSQYKGQLCSNAALGGFFKLFVGESKLLLCSFFPQLVVCRTNGILYLYITLVARMHTTL